MIAYPPNGGIPPGEVIRERRLNRRVELGLPSRFALPDGSEHGCVLSDLSVEGVALDTHVKARIGDLVKIDMIEIGRVDGIVMRNPPGQLIIALDIPQSKRGTLARRIETAKARKTDGLRQPPAPQPDDAARRDAERFARNMAETLFNLITSSAPNRAT